MKNSVILKIEKTDREKLNKELEKNNAYKITEKITENNKALVFTNNAVKLLNENGVNITKKYISYNANQALYNMLKNIITENNDVFTLISK